MLIFLDENNHLVFIIAMLSSCNYIITSKWDFVLFKEKLSFVKAWREFVVKIFLLINWTRIVKILREMKSIFSPIVLSNKTKIWISSESEENGSRIRCICDFFHQPGVYVERLWEYKFKTAEMSTQFKLLMKIEFEWL